MTVKGWTAQSNARFINELFNIIEAPFTEKRLKRPSSSKVRQVTAVHSAYVCVCVCVSVCLCVFLRYELHQTHTHTITFTHNDGHAWFVRHCAKGRAAIAEAEAIKTTVDEIPSLLAESTECKVRSTCLETIPANTHTCTSTYTHALNLNPSLVWPCCQVCVVGNVIDIIKSDRVLLSSNEHTLKCSLLDKTQAQVTTLGKRVKALGIAGFSTSLLE